MNMEILKKIVVPVDFEDNTEYLVDYASELARKFDAEMYLIHVIPMGYSLGGEMVVRYSAIKEDEYKSSVEKMMERLVAVTGKDGIRCNGKVFVGDPAEEIVQYVDDVGADMVIISTHGTKGLEKILLGSVTSRVVKRSNCPVLSMNPYKMKK